MPMNLFKSVGDKVDLFLLCLFVSEEEDDDDESVEMR